MENKWKTTAIIFIVLFASLALFNLFLFYVGKEIAEKENECVLSCERYYTSSYDSDIQMCYCFDDDYEIVKQKYIE